MSRHGNFECAVFPYTYIKRKDRYAFIAAFTDPDRIANEIPTDLKEIFPAVKDRVLPEDRPKINEEIEKAFIENGRKYFRSGDLGFMDEGGYFFILLHKG
jgi:acyl-CoA synthetase (AMP-forming)/AMP-acid ligase II